MEKIKEFGNLIKYDFTKCNRCLDCIKECDTNALFFDNNVISFNKEKCYACKKCLNICTSHALYYYINDVCISKEDSIAVVPYDANPIFIKDKYDKVETNLIGEKVKIIETAFEMEKISSDKIEGNVIKTLIISDIENLNLILKTKEEKAYQYLSKIESSYFLANYIYRLINMNKNLKTVNYGIPFEQKLNLVNTKLIDVINDIPYKSSSYYSPIDILNVYIDLCKLKCDEDLNNLLLDQNKELILSNKYLQVKVLLTTNILSLSNSNIYNYDFVFVLKNNSYKLRPSVLYDDEVNKLYKTKLKNPLKTNAFFRKG